MKISNYKNSLIKTVAFIAMGFSAHAEKRNIIFITADDLGTQLSCYGDPNVQTPNIDRIAAEGTRFTNAYVTAASCSPSRGTMMTGLYPHQHGMFGLSQLKWAKMHNNVPKLPNELKKSGYYTGLIGKSHFQPFNLFQWDFYDEDIHNYIIGRDSNLMAESVDLFIKKAKAHPFFLFLNYVDPHRGNTGGMPPLFPRTYEGIPENPISEDEVEPFPFLGLDSPEIRKEMADFYGCMQRLDAGVGALWEVLEKHDLLKNTLIVFIGDHGPDVTRGKMCIYESATKIPLLVYDPSGAGKGQVLDHFVSTIDIFPTIMEFAGKDECLVDERQQGISFLPLMNGRERRSDREYLFSEYITHIPSQFFPRYGVRNERYKLIYNIRAGETNPVGAPFRCAAWGESRKSKYEGTLIRKAYDTFDTPPEFELYDLYDDPYEFNNLAVNAAYQPIVNALKTEIDKWRVATQDPLLDVEFYRSLEVRLIGKRNERVAAH